MNSLRPSPGIWIFGDYRNYFHNRVTLQLIAKGRELAKRLNSQVAVLVLGEDIHQYAMEYVAHGADWIIAGEHPLLKDYQVETFTEVIALWAEAFKPEILLAGATDFGREFFPRLAKRLKTGLSADCLALEIDPDTGLLVQTTPAFGGQLLAEIITPHHRPQMATVHPGIFQEAPHNPAATAKIIYPEITPLRESRMKIIRSRLQQGKRSGLENSPVVVAAGKGLGTKAYFDLAVELADLLGGELGATRPVVALGWIGEESLLGQTGKTTRARLVITLGASGALQFTTGIQGAEKVVAINRDPHAPIFKEADLGVVGDLKVLLPMLVEELKKRL